jgi:probable rRNA maturation factor
MSRRGRLRVSVVDAKGRPTSAPGLGRWLEGVAPLRRTAEVTIALMSDRRVRTLNRLYRGRDMCTDVLSFPFGPLDVTREAVVDSHKCLTTQGLYGTSGAVHLGDIAIGLGVARRQARRVGHSLSTELRVLALHGLLHVIGYDHDVDNGAMAELERRLRRKGRLMEGLIERARHPPLRHR